MFKVIFWTNKRALSKAIGHYFKWGELLFHLCISQFHLRPAPIPLPGWLPGISIFFLPWMANSRGWKKKKEEVPIVKQLKLGVDPSVFFQVHIGSSRHICPWINEGFKKATQTSTKYCLHGWVKILLWNKFTRLFRLLTKLRGKNIKILVLCKYQICDSFLIWKTLDQRCAWVVCSKKSLFKGLSIDWETLKSAMIYWKWRRLRILLIKV